MKDLKIKKILLSIILVTALMFSINLQTKAQAVWYLTEEGSHGDMQRAIKEGLIDEEGNLLRDPGKSLIISNEAATKGDGHDFEKTFVPVEETGEEVVPEGNEESTKIDIEDPTGLGNAPVINKGDENPVEEEIPTEELETTPIKEDEEGQLPINIVKIALLILGVIVVGLIIKLIVGSMKRKQQEEAPPMPKDFIDEDLTRNIHNENGIDSYDNEDEPIDYLGIIQGSEEDDER